MPYPNEHAARIHPPGQYDSFVRKNIAPGIDAIFGIKDGKSEIQAYRFDRTKFSEKEARQWLAEHKASFIDFEPASNEAINAAIRAAARK